MIVQKEELMLTTFDNPFDPFDQFDDWFKFDCDKKYFTCSFIDRIVQSRNPNVLTTNIDDDEYDEAIKEIVFYNPNVYRIVRRTVEVDSIYLTD